MRSTKQVNLATDEPVQANKLKPLDDTVMNLTIKIQPSLNAEMGHNEPEAQTKCRSWVRDAKIIRRQVF